MRMGPLQRHLRKGEYRLFKYSPMFESDFVQISKQGGPVEIHNQEQIVTVGLTATSPVLLLPNVLLVAKPIHLSRDPTQPHDIEPHCEHHVRYELSRLFPLSLIKISVHNAERQQLRFKLASGRTFYLQLCPESDRREDLFDTWVRIIQLLRPPSDTKLETKEKAVESNHIRNLPPPKPKAPSPKQPTLSTTAWSELTTTQTLVGNKDQKNASKATSLASPAKAQGPAQSHRAEGEAVLVSPQVATDVLEEKQVERHPSRRSPAGEKGRRENSPPSRRSAKKGYSSRSRSRQRGAHRKPSKLLSLIRACSWGSPKKDSHLARPWSKEKRQSAR